MTAKTMIDKKATERSRGSKVSAGKPGTAKTRARSGAGKPTPAKSNKGSSERVKASGRPKVSAGAPAPALSGGLLSADRLSSRMREGAFIGFAFVCVYAFIALSTYHADDPGWSTTGAGHDTARNTAGLIGAYLSDVFYTLFGYMAFLFPIMLGYRAWLIFRERHQPVPFDGFITALRLVGFVLVMLSATGLSHINVVDQAVLPEGAGGVLGTLVGQTCLDAFNVTGARLLLLAIFLFGVTLFTGLSWLKLMDDTGRLALVAYRHTCTYLRQQMEYWQARQERLGVLRKRQMEMEPSTAMGDSITSPARPAPAKMSKPRPIEVREESPVEMSMRPSFEPPVQPRALDKTQAMAKTQVLKPVERVAVKAVPKPTEAAAQEASPRSMPRIESPDEKVPEQKIPQQRVPEQRVPEQRVPEQRVPERRVPEQRVPEQRVPEQRVPEQRVPEQRVPEHIVAEPSAVKSHVAVSHYAEKPQTNNNVEEPKAAERIVAQNPLPESEVPPARVKAPSKPIEHGERLFQEMQTRLFDTTHDGLMPHIDLLNKPDDSNTKGFSQEDLQMLSVRLEDRLKDFGIQAVVKAVLPGPVITRFEIDPAAGVKVSKITGLAKDLARSLSVVSVRVVEVIPGKSYVGIEIPNEDRDMVFLSQVLSSKTYEEARSPLTLALGHDISGNPIMADLAKMPHLLVAGTTGSGKSVGVNAMLLSILYKAGPDEVRLIMVDPKMLELSVYDGIPHLLTPVITDMNDAASGLRWCVGEMERRYKLMAALGVRNLQGYNRKVKDAASNGAPIPDPLWQPDENLFEAGASVEPPELEALPFIVVVIDEFADMMMIVGKKVEELIARIAQKARAAGIHLVLATQRPSVDVITGLIKANIPSRIAFQVSSKIDSRTILDQGGADQLLGHGDMLYLPPGTSLPVRVHGAFVDDDEVHRVVNDWKTRAEPNYVNDLLEEGANEFVPGYSQPGSSSGEEDGESEPLYDEAVHFVTQSRKASISSVQRKLRIGYNRAARMIETMEEAGVISAMGSNGQREVLAPTPPGD